MNEIIIGPESNLSTPVGNGQENAKVPDEALTELVQSIPVLAGKDCIGDPDNVGALLNSELPVDYRGCSYKTKPNEMNTHIEDKSYVKGAMDIPSPFERELEGLINRYSVEGDTPDFILARYLAGCMEVFGRTMKDRDNWYGLSSPSH